MFKALFKDLASGFCALHALSVSVCNFFIDLFPDRGTFLFQQVNIGLNDVRIQLAATAEGLIKRFSCFLPDSGVMKMTSWRECPFSLKPLTTEVSVILVDLGKEVHHRYRTLVTVKLSSECNRTGFDVAVLEPG